MGEIALQKNMFEKIDDVAQLAQIWNDLCSSKIDIQAKVGNLEKIILNPLKILTGQVYASVSPSQDLANEEKKEFIGQFFLRGDKYFFQTAWSYEKSLVIFSNQTQVYKVQRRQNYRLKVPDNFITQFKIFSINELTNSLQAKIHDLSSGGCCVVCSADMQIKKDDSIKAEITLGNRAPQSIDCTIRHVRPQIIDQKRCILIGIQFTMTPALDSQLFTIMMELSRKYLKS